MKKVISLALFSALVLMMILAQKARSQDGIRHETPTSIARNASQW